MKKYVYITLIIVIVGLGWKVTQKDGLLNYELGIVHKSALVQEVSATGRIVSSEHRTLSFERGGSVFNVHVKVGDFVKSGDILASLNVNELTAKLNQSKAVLDAERSVLQGLLTGTRKEEIKIAKISVTNAERSLALAETNLITAHEKSQANLALLYDGVVTALQSSVVNAKNALIVLSNIQESHFDNFNQQSFDIAQDKETIVYELLGQQGGGYWETEFISTLDGGLFGDVHLLSRELDDKEIDVQLIQTLRVLDMLRDALNGIPIISEMTSVQRSILIAEKTTISAEITALSSKAQLINVQRVLNESTINVSEASITSAENNLLHLQSQLTLKLSGNTVTTVAAQEARVRAQEATVELYNAQLNTSILYAPIDGSITMQKAEVGVVVAAGYPIISVQSVGNYEIEAFIPEADITKVSISDVANVTLDAYSDDTVLTAEVLMIDPAETIIEGVPTYKVTFTITEGLDLVKSGMTANIDIITETKIDVLNVPVRSVFTEDGQKFVRRVNNDGEIIMLPINVGLRSSDGRIEVTKGLKENQEIVTFMRQ